MARPGRAPRPGRAVSRITVLNLGGRLALGREFGGGNWFAEARLLTGDNIKDNGMAGAQIGRRL